MLLDLIMMCPPRTAWVLGGATEQGAGGDAAQLRRRRQHEDPVERDVARGLADRVRRDGERAALPAHGVPLYLDRHVRFVARMPALLVAGGARLVGRALRLQLEAALPLVQHQVTFDDRVLANLVERARLRRQ